MVPSLPIIYPDCVGLVYWLMLWHVCFCFIGIIGLVLLQTSLGRALHGQQVLWWLLGTLGGVVGGCGWVMQ